MAVALPVTLVLPTKPFSIEINFMKGNFYICLPKVMVSRQKRLTLTNQVSFFFKG